MTNYEPLEDPALRETADRVQRVMRSSPLRPEFRDRLRTELVTAQAEVIAANKTSAEPASAPAWRRRASGWLRRPPVIAWVGATVAAVVVGVVLVAYGLPSLTGPKTASVAAVSEVQGAISVDPTAPLRLRFSEPMDDATIKAAMRLTPAATLQSHWEGTTLTVSPEHGLTPNSAYLLSIDHTIARTASGARLPADLHFVFGTAATAGIGKAAGTPVALPRSRLADAADGSEAVVARDGSVLLTGAQAGSTTGFNSGLVRVKGGNASQVSPATDAICLSRSGRSLVWLTGSGADTQVVFAGGDGSIQKKVPVAVDPGSPLGWIDDAKASFVKGGKLQAVDRNGTIESLSDVPVNAAKDTVVISPGGRYAYLRRDGAPDTSGQLIDLTTKKSHTLPGITGDPAFSADGATVVWVDSTGPRIAMAPSGGGPVLTAPLPVKPGDTVSDLSVSPAGAWFVYSVTHADHKAELRLASLPDGQTLAVSTAGAGQSPNWSASGRLFTVLASGSGGSRIETVTVPQKVADDQAEFEATAAAFANAQVGADQGAQHALAAAGVTLPDLPQVTRSTVLWVLRLPDGTATAQVRLTADPQPGSLTATQTEETLTLAPGTADSPPTVRTVKAGQFGPAPQGPHLVRLDTDATPGAVRLGFDSDLDQASLQALQLTTSEGALIPSKAAYDPATRTVTLNPESQVSGTVVVRIGTGLRDTNGAATSTEVKVTTSI
jgi:hypothetical protein